MTVFRDIRGRNESEASEGFREVCSTEVYSVFLSKTSDDRQNVGDFVVWNCDILDVVHQKTVFRILSPFHHWRPAASVAHAAPQSESLFSGVASDSFNSTVRVSFLQTNKHDYSKTYYISLQFTQIILKTSVLSYVLCL